MFGKMFGRRPRLWVFLPHIKRLSYLTADGSVQVKLLMVFIMDIYIRIWKSFVSKLLCRVFINPHPHPRGVFIILLVMCLQCPHVWNLYLKDLMAIIINNKGIKSLQSVAKIPITEIFSDYPPIPEYILTCWQVLTLAPSYFRNPSEIWYLLF